MYLFAPLEHQYDKGFGAVADSFQDAGNALKAQYCRAMLNGHLPICYLFRHAIELFLKGSIIIVHKGFKIPCGSEPCTGVPKIPKMKKGKLEQTPIYKIHEIDLLYKYLSKLLNENKDGVEAIFNGWKFKDDFEEKLKYLEKIDSSSTFFRYPEDKNPSIYQKEKSAFKKKTVEEVIAIAKRNQEPIKTMKTVSLIGRGDQVFIHDDSFTDKVVDLLDEILEDVSTCHFVLINKIGGMAWHDEEKHF